jgi:NADPH:quinone reductase-like Zn-dependent oxidoreductase
MKGIVQSRYGSPDVLRLEEIAKPVAKDDEVLVRVCAAAVNTGDWHLLRGVPYVMRLVLGLRGPRRKTPGLDIAGQVEAVGGNVKQLRPGDEVFGWCKGAVAEYACTAERNLLSKPSNLKFEQAAAVGDSAFTALAAVRDQGRVRPGQRVLINGASGGVGTFAVQIAKSFGANVTGGLQHHEHRPRPIAWRGSGHRLHERGLHPKRGPLRRDARSGRESLAIGLQTGAESRRNLRWSRSPSPGARTVCGAVIVVMWISSV